MLNLIRLEGKANWNVVRVWWFFLTRGKYFS